jgi:hypothetical protein
MPRHLYQTPGAHTIIPAGATRAPLRALSCPYGSRGVVGRQDEEPKLHTTFRSFGPDDRGARNQGSPEAAEPWHWCDSLATDYWNPPTSASQHARQRILAVIVAFVLAAILAQAGW